MSERHDHHPLTRPTRRAAIAAGAATGLSMLLPAVHAADAPATPMKDQPLYLHWFHPTYYFPNQTEPAARLISVLVVPGQDFDIAVGDQSQSIRGRINRDGNAFTVNVDATYLTSMLLFRGPATLDRVFDAAGGGFSGAICRTRCVLSHDRSCDRFIAAQLAEEARRASAVVVPR